MNWLQSLLYALVSGLAEFLPISSHAHKAMLLYLFGCAEEPPLLGLFIHIGIAIALFFGAKTYLVRLQREYRLMRLPKHRRSRQPLRQSVFDITLLKFAVIPLVLAFIWYNKTLFWRGSLHYVAIFLALNGLILHIPLYLPRGNKDAQNITRIDALLFGIFGALSAFPGISRIGSISSIAGARGADTQQTFKWALLLSFPVLAGYICYDIYAIFASGFAGIYFTLFLQSIFCGAVAFLGARAAIAGIRFLTVRTGLYGFSYYSWGAALFTFILYMTI